MTWSWHGNHGDATRALHAEIFRLSGVTRIAVFEQVIAAWSTIANDADLDVARCYCGGTCGAAAPVM